MSLTFLQLEHKGPVGISTTTNFFLCHKTLLESDLEPEYSKAPSVHSEDKEV